jgi:hypothetical protein
VCALYWEGKHTIEMSVMVHYVQSKMNHLGGHKQKNTGLNYGDGVSVTQIRPDMNPVEKMWVILDEWENLNQNQI